MSTAPDTEELRRQLVGTAERHGAAVVHIDGDEHNPPYAFSVGAWRRFGKPEIVVLGLPSEAAHAVVNIYVQRAGRGERFVPGRLYEGFADGCPVTMEKVATEHYPEYLGSALLVYGDDDFPALQMIVSIPATGVFPWQPEAPDGFAAHVPLLTSSGAPESWTPGQDGP